MNCSTKGFLVLHHLLEFSQTHVRLMLKLIELVMPFNHFIPWTRDCGLCLIEGAVGDQDGAKGYTLEVLS